LCDLNCAVLAVGRKQLVRGLVGTVQRWVRAHC